jgi:glycosyltransferase involved in cell wall biosynthesis
VKIGYIAKTVDPKNGAGRYASEVINHIKKLESEVVVLTEEGHQLEGRPIIKKRFGIISSFFIVRSALKDCDIVHAFDVWPYAIHAYLGVVGTNKKLFLSGVGTYSVAPLDSFLKRQILKVIFKRTNHILCISEYVMKEMQKRAVLQAISVVHLGFTPLLHISEEEKINFNNEYGIDSDKKPVLLTVGAVKDRKGQFDTLQSLGGLIRLYPNLLYVMVGSTNEIAYVDLG